MDELGVDADVKTTQRQRQLLNYLKHLAESQKLKPPSIDKKTRRTLRLSNQVSNVKREDCEQFRETTDQILKWMTEHASTLEGMCCYRFMLGTKDQVFIQKYCVSLLKKLQLQKSRSEFLQFVHTKLIDDALPRGVPIIKALRGKDNELKAYYHLARFMLLELTVFPCRTDEVNVKRSSIFTGFSMGKRKRRNCRNKCSFSINGGGILGFDEVQKLSPNLLQSLQIEICTPFLKAYKDFYYRISWLAFLVLWNSCNGDKSPILESSRGGVFQAVLIDDFDVFPPDLTLQKLQTLKTTFSTRTAGFQVSDGVNVVDFGFNPNCFGGIEASDVFVSSGLMKRPSAQEAIQNSVDPDSLFYKELETKKNAMLVFQVGVYMVGEINLLCKSKKFQVVDLGLKPKDYLHSSAKELICAASLYRKSTSKYDRHNLQSFIDHVNYVFGKLQGTKTMLSDVFNSKLYEPLSYGTYKEGGGYSGLVFFRICWDFREELDRLDYRNYKKRMETHICESVAGLTDTKYREETARYIKERLNVIQDWEIPFLGPSSLPRWLNEPLKQFLFQTANVQIPRKDLKLWNLLDTPKTCMLYSATQIILKSIISELQKEFEATEASAFDGVEIQTIAGVPR
jgi:hypothetical protein